MADTIVVPSTSQKFSETARSTKQFPAFDEAAYDGTLASLHTPCAQQERNPEMNVPTTQPQTLVDALREQTINLNTARFHELTGRWSWVGEPHQGSTCPMHRGLILRTNLDWILHLHDEHPDRLLAAIASMEPRELATSTASQRAQRAIAR